MRRGEDIGRGPLAGDGSRWLACALADDVPLPPADRAALIGVLPGEGVAPELTDAAVTVLQAVNERFDLALHVRPGPSDCPRSLGDEVRDFFRGVFADGGAVLSGAVGGRFVYDLRREFDLYCKLVPLRPWGVLAGAPFAAGHLDGVDVVVVRENTGGVYQGDSIETVGPDRRVAHAFGYDAAEVERVLRAAARLAARRRGGLAVVLKDGGLPAMSRLWRDCAAAVAPQAGVAPTFLDVDLAAYRLVRAPAELDVVVAPNLFGDVLADVGALLLGGRGLSFSGNFAPGGQAVYQTNHGSAADLQGTDSANPVGQISALAMLLRESAGQPEAAAAIERAVAATWAAGWRTRDVAVAGCRVVGTREMTARVVSALRRPEASDAARPAAR